MAQCTCSCETKSPFAITNFLIWVTAISFLLLSTSSRAFNSPEHCAISNLAADIAFEYVIHVEGELDWSKYSKAQKATFENLQKAQTIWLPTSKNSVTGQNALSANVCSPKKWAFSVSAIPFSYGKVVALVDYTLDPNALFSSSGRTSRIPRSTKQLSKNYFFGPPVPDSPDKSATVKQSAIIEPEDKCQHPPASKEESTSFRNLKLLLRYWLAAHNNPRHFQEGAIDSFDRFHEDAIDAVKDRVPGDAPNKSGCSKDKTEGDPALFRAIAYSAAADHFLEDIFAPGHIVTPRDGLYDAIALSWHDAFNDRGRVMAIRNWERLEPIYLFLRENADKTGRFSTEFQQIGDSTKNLASRTPLRKALSDLVSDSGIDRKEDGSIECQPNTHRDWRAGLDWLADPKAKKYAPILDLDVGLLADFTGPETNRQGKVVWPTAICLHGDDSLDEHEPTTSSGVAAQKAFMVIVEARYILDVLEAYLAASNIPASKSVADSTFLGTMDDRTWCPMIGEKTAQSGTASAVQPKSCKDLLALAADRCKPEQCKNVYMIPTSIMEYGAYLSSPKTNKVLNFGTLDFRDFIYGLHWSKLAANKTIDSVAGVDVGSGFVFGVNKPDDVEEVNSLPFSLFYSGGWQWYLSDTVRRSQAFTSRAMFQVPSIDIQMGAYGNLEDIGDGYARRWRWAYGGRIETGFSLLTLHISLGLEPTLTEPVRTARGFAVEAGFAFAINGRRAWSDSHAQDLLNWIDQKFRGRQ